MKTISDLENKPGGSRVFIAGMLVVGVALGWWAYRSRQSPVQPAPQASPVASSPAPAVDSTRPATPVASANTYLTAGYSELLALLRNKLAGSGEEALAALAEIAKNRPDLAIALAQELGRTDAEKSLWVTGLVNSWARRDPKHAWDWLVQPNNKLANNPVVGAVMDAMASSDPEMLLGNIDVLLLTNDTSGSPFSARNSVYMGLQALVKNGNLALARAAVESWANDSVNLQIGTAAYEIVAMAMDQASPENTAAWLKSLPVSEDRNAAIGTFAVTWGGSDPGGAMRWAETLQPQEGQSEAVGKIFVQWMQNDPGAAMNWLDNYIPRTAGSLQDDVLIGSMILFSPTAKSDPNEALALADSIANPETRQLYQQQIIQSWARTDPESAIKSVLTSKTIPEDQKQILNRLIQETYQQTISPSQSEQ
jgi:hypothetical protein